MPCRLALLGRCPFVACILPEGRRIEDWRAGNYQKSEKKRFYVLGGKYDKLTDMMTDELLKLCITLKLDYCVYASGASRGRPICLLGICSFILFNEGRYMSVHLPVVQSNIEMKK